MIYKNGERMRDFLGLFINKTIIPLTLVGYEMINSQLGATRLVGYLFNNYSMSPRWI